MNLPAVPMDRPGFLDKLGLFHAMMAVSVRLLIRICSMFNPFVIESFVSSYSCPHYFNLTEFYIRQSVFVRSVAYKLSFVRI